jgi:hypothetical protein
MGKTRNKGVNGEREGRKGEETGDGRQETGKQNQLRKRSTVNGERKRQKGLSF